MRARPHHSDVEPESLRDLRVRSPLDIAQHQHRPVGAGQLVDRRAQCRPQLRLDGGIVRSRRPVGDRLGVAPALVEQREHLVQRDLVPAALPAAKLLAGGVRHDAVEPRPECGLAAKHVDLSNHGPERILHDFLRVLAVAGHAAGQTIGTLAVRAHQTLRGHGLVTPERLQEIVIAVYAGRGGGSIDVPFEHHLKIHLASSPLSVNVRSSTAKTTVRGRTHLPDVGRVGIHPTFVGYAPAGWRRARRRSPPREDHLLEIVIERR